MIRVDSGVSPLLPVLRQKMVRGHTKAGQKQNQRTDWILSNYYSDPVGIKCITGADHAIKTA